MGINAMENQAYDPRESNANNVWGTIMVVLLAVVVIFVIGYGVKWAWDKSTVPAPVSAIIEKATSSDAGTGYRNYCVNGTCVKVKMCTSVNDECGDMTQGPKADYGTGFHTSGEGTTVLSSGVVYQIHRERPNPPVGWKWSGK